MATLQRLGEDVESSLKQLLFGTVRRNLRAQIMEEINRYGYLGPFEWKILDRISLLEVLELCNIPCFMFSYRRMWLCINVLAEN